MEAQVAGPVLTGAVRILGIDLASQPEKTGVVLVDVEESALPVAHLVPGRATDDALVAWAKLVDRIGIDAPMGWPNAFVEGMVNHVEYRSWDAAGEVKGLTHRVTDHVVHDQTGIWPLSVSADKLAYVAFRCAHLQQRFAEEVWDGVPAPRDGSGRLVETYPAAALRMWGLPYKSYKGDSGEAACRTILDGLRRRVELGEVERAAIRSDHVLDALVSALVVVELMNGRTIKPRTEEEAAAARLEGWIHLPSSTWVPA